ncbi:hypothetical protein [Clostridium sp.]|uniref:hypothetical protein n=1 Tax=Clostridium sp. TaxID=1506 RepID=UPI0025B8D55E|nr:hypothetical protein [Clostridium sp.]
MMKEDCIECKGNMLKAVITRIDFDDLYEIEKNVLKELKKIAIDNELTLNMTRELNAEEDFELNDPVILRELPVEYIKNCMCYAYFNEKLDIMVEVNQFFIRIIYKVNNNNYKEYSQNILPLIMAFIDPLLSDELIIRRVSIKKVDETKFNKLEEMDRVFKPEIVQSNIFSNQVRWDIPSSGSTVVQNFGYDDTKVNFFRKIDRVSVRERIESRVMDNIYYRIYVEYEVYDRKTRNNIEKTELEKLLEKINHITRKLFKDSFTDDGWDIISKGGKVGSYECN